MAFVHRLDRTLAVLERFAVILLLVSLLGLGLVHIILRNVFASGLFWADEVLRHLVLWLGFLGASLATHDRRHLRMEVLTHWMSDSGKLWTSLITHLFALGGCLVLARAAWAFVQFEYESGAVLSVGLEVWIAQGIVPIGLLLIAFRFAVQLLNILVQLRRVGS